MSRPTKTPERDIITANIRAENAAVQGWLENQEQGAKPKRWEDLTGDQISQLLNDIAQGEFHITVAKRYGISRRAIYQKAYRCEDFSKRLAEARRSGAQALVENAMLAGLGVEGYSTGDTARDKMVAELAWKMAKTMNPAELGDKIQVEQKTFNIHIDQKVSDAWGVPKAQIIEEQKKLDDHRDDDDTAGES